MNFNSQYGQDRFLFEEFFSSIRKGVFIDIGAHDGVAFNNTYVFEKELNWTGICIEPNPSCFSKLEENRSCACENCCVYDRDGTISFTAITGYPEMLSGITETYEGQMLQRIDSEIQSTGGSKKTIEVPCYRLNTLLEKYGIVHVNFCSIDTEGSEFKILNSADFSKMKIDIFSIENNYNKEDTQNLLLNKGYKKIKNIGVDEIYLNIK